MSTYNKIVSCSSYLPNNCISNSDLSKIVDTSDDWIKQRTGIEQRYISESETTAELGAKASEQAIKQANISKSDIDAIITATTTPDNTFPATATKIQNLLGITQGFAFDVQAVCSGFIYAISVADAMMKNSNRLNNILVIGTDRLSKIVDWKDRNTCVLFGDGAGAIVIQNPKFKSQENNSINIEGDIIDYNLYSNGKYYDILKTTGGAGSDSTSGFITMQGQQVFKFAIESMKKTINELLTNNNLTKEDISLLIPHQANIRIIKELTHYLNMSDKQVVITINKHANTSAASIPLALSTIIPQNLIKPNMYVILCGIGGGMSWGSILLKFK